jgi:hypothetical protein
MLLSMREKKDETEELADVSWAKMANGRSTH